MEENYNCAITVNDVKKSNSEKREKSKLLGNSKIMIHI